MRNYEVVTKTNYDGKIDYHANIFNVSVPVSNKTQDELWDEFDEKANQYLDLFTEHINKNKEFSGEAYISGATSQIVPYGVSPKDIYWNCFANKYSRSWTKNYLKYKKCVKYHKESMVYFTEHVDNFFCTSCMTEKELEEQRKGHDELVALYHTDNCTFIMSEINKGLLYAIKKDVARFFTKFYYI